MGSIVESPGAGAATETLQWHSCQSVAARCTSVEVPVNYGQPDGRKIPLAVIEEPAADPGADDGVLMVNPGGPGESGVEILAVYAALMPPEVRDHFDLVSFDERGTGESDPLDCGPSPAVTASVDPLPTRLGGTFP